MPKAAALINRKAVALSDAEKAMYLADKALYSVLTRAGSSKATAATFRERVNSIMDTLEQSGDKVGKRISGAKSHEFADQLAAFADKHVRGHVSGMIAD